MSAVWCFFDLSEAMCQLCKAGVSGSVESGGELEMRGTAALKMKADINRLSFMEKGIIK